MIRILHVLGGLERGGAETMVMNLYRAIDRTQVQFDFIIHTTKHQAYYDEIIALGGKIYSFPAFDGLNYFKMKKLWKLFFKEHPEYRILHSHVRSYASLYLPIAKKAGLRTIIHSHNTSSGKGLKALAKFLLQRRLRKCADFYFACSNAAGEWLFGKKITTMPNYILLKNAIDVEKYKFSELSRKKVRDEFNLKDKFIIGHVGRFHPQKNHLFLLDVFAGIHKKHPESVLMLVGTGEMLNLVKERVVDLKIDDSVIFTGSRADVNELLSAFDVFLFPSLFEGLPVTLVEAQTAGLVSFVSDSVTKEIAMSELIRYIPINQGVEPWVEAVEKCSVNRKDFSDKMRKEGYDIHTTSKNLEIFYKSILS